MYTTKAIHVQEHHLALFSELSPVLFGNVELLDLLLLLHLPPTE